MVVTGGIQLIGKILIGALVIAVCAVLWYVLTQKNSAKSGCSGNCAGCSARCDSRKEE